MLYNNMIINLIKIKKRIILVPVVLKEKNHTCPCGGKIKESYLSWW